MDTYTNPKEVLQLKLKVAQQDKQLIELQHRLLAAMTPPVDAAIAKAEKDLADFESLMAESLQ